MKKILKVLLLLTASLYAKPFVQCANEQCGLMESDGFWIVEPNYEHISYNPEGLSRFIENGQFGYLDASGKVVISPQESNIYSFAPSGLARFKKNNKWGVTDKKFETIVPAKYEFLTDYAPNGLAAAKQDGKYGFIDSKGAVIIPFKYTFATSFAPNGLAAIEKDGLYGYIDAHDNMVIKPQYKRASTFSQNGLALVLKEEGFGFINAKGEVAIEFKKQKMEPFAQNSLALIQKEGKFGFMDSHGKIVIPTIYDYAQSFMPNGHAIVQKNAKYGVIDSNGAFKIKPEFTNIRNPSGDDSLALKHESRGWEVYDMSSGKIIATFKADEKDVAYEISNAKGEIIWPKNAQTVAVTSQPANIVKKAPEPIVKKAKTVNTSNIIWEAKVDFAGGYYDTFYHEGLFVAVPSMYNKNADYRPVADPKNVNTCYPLGTKFNHVTMKGFEDAKEESDIMLYQNNLPISQIKSVSINEMSNWRLPKAESLGEHFDIWSKNQCLRHGQHNYAYRYFTIWEFAYNTYGRLTFYGYENDPVILVRTASDIEKSVYEDKSLDTRGKIKRLAELLTQAELTPAKKSIAVPVMLKFLPEPTLTKGEFETTADFEKRKSLKYAEWEKNKQITQAKNQAMMEQYEKQLQEADTIYQAQMSKLNNESLQQQIYEKSIKYALSVVLGKPYFKDLKYDADAQKMRGVVFAANDPSFQSSVEFDVALSVAKTFKQDIQDNKYVPLISFDDALSVSSVKVVSNESLKKFKQQQAAAQNQKQKEEDEEARKQAAKDAESQKRRESINKLYNLPKNIGDKVCNKMETCGLFGCDSYEVSAFVEGKSGDRIQIRIADPKVMRSYQGVDIYKGSILWDQYNNWKPCN